ncbi:MAG: hypothetical protein AAGA32_05060 [Pseudomonadota bacterium]
MAAEGDTPYALPPAGIAPGAGWMAMDLSGDGIALWASDGLGWHELERVPLQVGTLTRNLARLREMAGGEGAVEVWLPTTEAFRARGRPEDAATLFADARFAVDELDVAAGPTNEDGVAALTAVPRPVLAEAETFLSAHGFRVRAHRVAAAELEVDAPLFAAAAAPTRRELGFGWVIPTAAVALIAAGIGLAVIVPSIMMPRDARGLPDRTSQIMLALHPLSREPETLSVVAPAQVTEPARAALGERPVQAAPPEALAAVDGAQAPTALVEAGTPAGPTQSDVGQVLPRFSRPHELVQPVAPAGEHALHALLRFEGRAMTASPTLARPQRMEADVTRLSARRSTWTAPGQPRKPAQRDPAYDMLGATESQTEAPPPLVSVSADPPPRVPAPPMGIPRVALAAAPSARDPLFAFAADGPRPQTAAEGLPAVPEPSLEMSPVLAEAAADPPIRAQRDALAGLMSRLDNEAPEIVTVADSPPPQRAEADATVAAAGPEDGRALPGADLTPEPERPGSGPVVAPDGPSTVVADGTSRGARADPTVASAALSPRGARTPANSVDPAAATISSAERSAALPRGSEPSARDGADQTGDWALGSGVLVIGQRPEIVPPQRPFLVLTPSAGESVEPADLPGAPGSLAALVVQPGQGPDLSGAEPAVEDLSGTNNAGASLAALPPRAGAPDIIPPSRATAGVFAVAPASLDQQAAARAALKARAEEDLTPTAQAPSDVQAPRARPESVVAAARRAEAAARDAPPSGLALQSTTRPVPRPSRLAAVTAVAVRTTPAPGAIRPAAVAVPEPPVPAPSPPRAAPPLPSSASVARAATISDALPMRELALIGVFGTQTARHALVRLPGGRLVKVYSGDTVRGYQVTAISPDAIRLRRSGRDSLLVIPN